jgi:hypothetical protein
MLTFVSNDSVMTQSETSGNSFDSVPFGLPTLQLCMYRYSFFTGTILWIIDHSHFQNWFWVKIFVKIFAFYRIDFLHYKSDISDQKILGNVLMYEFDN